MKRKAPRTITRLAKERRARMWSQKYLGSRVGVRGASICQYETGVAKPSPKVADKLGALLACAPSELLDLVEVPA